MNVEFWDLLEDDALQPCQFIRHRKSTIKCLKHFAWMKNSPRMKIASDTQLHAYETVVVPVVL